MFRKLIVPILLCGLAVPVSAQQQENAAKADSGGIKWSTLKQCKRKVPVVGGGCAETAQVWYPYPERPTYCYIGYGVQLTTGKTIKVWVAPAGQTYPAGEDGDSWCHGVPFGCGGTYSPGGEAVPDILATCYEKYDWTAGMKKGDIAVFCDKKGNVAHTATSNGDGTYCSKNRYEKKKDKATKADMQMSYPAAKYDCKCYRKKPAPPPPPPPPPGGTTGSGTTGGGTVGGGGAMSDNVDMVQEPLVATGFYVQQTAPASSDGVFVFREGSGECVYAIPARVASTAQTTMSATIIGNAAGTFDVVVSFSPAALAAAQAAVAESPYGSDTNVFLVTNSEVTGEFNLGQMLQPTLVVETAPTYAIALETYNALYQ